MKGWRTQLISLGNMYNSVHRTFITKPLLDVMQDGITASASIKIGAESFPLGEYFFQTLFLRMTGAQEQKMKCICWEMATNDYAYRYDLLHNRNYGECSNYTDKNGIYKDIVCLIKEMLPSFKVYQLWEEEKLDDETLKSERAKWEKKIIANRKKQIRKNIEVQEKENGTSLSQDAKDKITANIMNKAMPEDDYAEHLAGIKKQKVVSSLLDDVFSMLKTANIIHWKEKEFDIYKDNYRKKFKGIQVTPKDISILGNQLQKFYEDVVYVHRNRCAHNTSSYQFNLPTLNTLASSGNTDQNYFYRFTMLIIIDEVFIRLYKRYVELKEQDEQ